MRVVKIARRDPSLSALPKASEPRISPSGCPGPTCHPKAHGTPRLKAGRYGVFGTSAALSSCGNRHLTRSRPVYRVSVAETSCRAVDLAFSGGPNEECVEAVRSTGRKPLIIAGVVTKVCVAFPALSAIEAGYEVFMDTDAAGTFNEVTRHAAWARKSAAGVQLIN